mmetsp:Transcript_44387/g.135295  ORF Transcript_44387/g.135295 Transcript_44387/m.135295 type:complete len:213 (-) Transcript_44387:115-753(-)
MRLFASRQDPRCDVSRPWHPPWQYFARAAFPNSSSPVAARTFPDASSPLAAAAFSNACLPVSPYLFWIRSFFPRPNVWNFEGGHTFALPMMKGCPWQQQQRRLVVLPACLGPACGRRLSHLGCRGQRKQREEEEEGLSFLLLGCRGQACDCHPIRLDPRNQSFPRWRLLVLSPECWSPACDRRHTSESSVTLRPPLSCDRHRPSHLELQHRR